MPKRQKPAAMRGVYPRELSNGTIVYDVILQHNRKRVCIGGFPTEAKAKHFYQKAKGLQSIGKFDPRQYQKRGQDPRKLDGPQTFVDFATQYLHDFRHILSPSRAQKITRLVNGSWKVAFGSVPIGLLTRDHIKDWIADLVAEEEERGRMRNPNTRRLMLSDLRVILGEAQAAGVLIGDPTYKLQRMCGTPVQFVVVPLSIEEEEQFLQGVLTHIPTWYPFWFLMLRTGLRLGEALALKPEDLDFKARKIWVRRSWTSDGRIQDYTKTKTDRRIDMARSLVPVLQEFIATGREQAACRWQDPPEYLFQGPTGRPYGHAHVRENIFRALIDTLKMRRFRIHDLRHTVACRLLERGDWRGVTIRGVQRLLGHKSITITCDVYLNFLPDREAFAVDVLDEPRPLDALCPQCHRPLDTPKTATNDPHDATKPLY